MNFINVVVSCMQYFKIVVSNNFPLSIQDFEYFIGYKDNKKIRSLCIFLTEMSSYRVDFDETKSTS